jgi:hypothetical protein
LVRQCIEQDSAIVIEDAAVVDRVGRTDETSAFNPFDATLQAVRVIGLFKLSHQCLAHGPADADRVNGYNASSEIL